MTRQDSMTRATRPRDARLAATLGTLLVAASTAAVANSDPDCGTPTLALDPAITPAVIARDWGRGETHAEHPAAVELRCGGKRIDSLPLHAALARLAHTPLSGVATPTWLVTEDLTAPAGTTSGPATLLVEVVDRHLRFAVAAAPDGRRLPIVLASTGKAAWRAVHDTRDPHAGDADDYLLVSCQPVGGDFVTSYRRYHLAPQGWTVQALTRHELWESDGEFPADSQFPPRP